MARKIQLVIGMGPEKGEGNERLSKRGCGTCQRSERTGRGDRRSFTDIYFRPKPIISMDRCPDCKGKGYLVISEDITRLAARLTEGLVKIT